MQRVLLMKLSDSHARRFDKNRCDFIAEVMTRPLTGKRMLHWYLECLHPVNATPSSCKLGGPSSVLQSQEEKPVLFSQLPNSKIKVPLWTIPISHYYFTLCTYITHPRHSSSVVQMIKKYLSLHHEVQSHPHVLKRVTYYLSKGDCYHSPIRLVRFPQSP